MRMTAVKLIIAETELTLPQFVVLMHVLGEQITAAITEFMLEDDSPLESALKELEQYFVMHKQSLRHFLEKNKAIDTEEKFLSTLRGNYRLLWEHPRSKGNSYFRVFSITTDPERVVDLKRTPNVVTRKPNPPEFLMIAGSGTGKILVGLEINSKGVEYFKRKMGYA